ncbi:MAG: alpha-amylase family glycosyl hydrolase [Bacteroidota bacterium]
MQLRHFLCLLLGLGVTALEAQILTVDPVFPTVNDEVTIFFDATEGTGGLANCNCDVYLHTGVITTESSNDSDWKNVITSWGVANDAWKLSPVPGQPNLYSYTIGPSILQYYNLNGSETVQQLAFVFRDATGSREGKATGGANIYYSVFQDNLPFSYQLLSPASASFIRRSGEPIEINIATSEAVSFRVFDNDALKATETGVSLQTSFAAGDTGDHTVRIEMLQNDQIIETATFNYVVLRTITPMPVPDDRPLGASIQGDTLMRLAFYAPMKQNVFVLGNFNNWIISNDYRMTPSPDGETWWADIDIRNESDIFYQFLIDGDLTVADPFSNLVLDPFNDGFIPEQTFPNLPSFPEGAVGITSWVRKNPPEYQWQVDDFERPAREDLVIYELLIRDFVEHQNYQTVIDSLDYLERLGINAIELMPINEFEGNDSWGYNPSFHLAVDKYYGTPEDLKRFVDECHKRGIAVIVDVVYNHAFGQSPLARMYWDEENNRPSEDSPYFNPIATHPFSVGNDFNHDSPATQYYTESAIRYWLEEYRIDGYRFDLATGFTQRNVGSDVGAWNRYEQARVDRLKQYMDVMEEASPGSYPILEYFPETSEKTAMVDLGAMVWSGNGVHGQYKNAILGNESNLNDTHYSSQGWTEPAWISYMESHDEQRLAYEALNFGRQIQGYSVRDFNTAMDRLETATVLYYAVPGPKMLWQFGELGYDYHINTCADTTVIEEPCRVGVKPIRWDYLNNQARKDLYDVTSDMLYLKNNFNAFRSDTPELDLGSGYLKKVILRDPEMDVVVHTNFHVIDQRITAPFPYPGLWYNYYTGDSVMVSNPSASIEYGPGGYAVYTSKRIERPSQANVVVNTQTVVRDQFNMELFPQPAAAADVQIRYQLPTASTVNIEVLDLQGRSLQLFSVGRQAAGQHQWIIPAQNFNAGSYIVRLQVDNQVEVKRMVIMH